MPDRVKGAIFSMLGSRYRTPGKLPDLLVADVFAGSGSMGLEALSRGAKSCVFFERDPGALKVLRDNLRNLAVGAEACVMEGDAWNHPMLSGSREYELVLLDPPYSDSDDDSPSGPLAKLLSRLAQSRMGTTIVVHHRKGTNVSVADWSGWTVVDQRVFGTNVVTILSR